MLTLVIIHSSAVWPHWEAANVIKCVVYSDPPLLFDAASHISCLLVITVTLFTWHRLYSHKSLTLKTRQDSLAREPSEHITSIISASSP